MPRLILAIVAAVGLLSAIVYSQWRPAPPHVSGILETDEIRLGSRIGGRVYTIHVSEGASVAAGDPLVTLEPYDLAQREQTAEAELAFRQAELAKLQAGLRTEEVAQARAHYEAMQAKFELVRAGPRSQEIAAAEQRLAAAQALNHLAQQNYQRDAKLLQENSISQSEYENADQQWRAAQAELAVRENELAILQSGARAEELAQAQATAEEARWAWELAQRGFRQEEIDAAAAAVRAAEGSLAAIREQKKELTVVAPRAGEIDALDLQPGDLTPPNAPVLTMVALDELWVRAYVPQSQLKIRVGDKLRVTIDAVPDREFSGEVTFIARQAEFTPSNVQTTDERAKQVYRIRVALPNSDRILRPGMTADVWLSPSGA